MRLVTLTYIYTREPIYIAEEHIVAIIASSNGSEIRLLDYMVEVTETPDEVIEAIRNSFTP